MTLSAIKKNVAHLPRRDRLALLRWLDRQEQTAWDAEMGKDFSPGGRGITLLDQVKAGVHSGEYRLMAGAARTRAK